MRITKLGIRNFRSFADDEAVLDLSGPAGYHVVVGPNAVGKSNLIEAIRWATLERYVTDQSIETWDFHGADTSRPIVVRVLIDPPIRYGDTFNRFHQVATLEFRAEEYRRGPKTGQVHCDHPVLDAAGNPIIINLTTRLAKDRKLTEEEKEAKQKPRPLSVRDLRSELPVYFLDGASCEYHLSMRAGSLMSQLGRALRMELMRDDDKLDWNGEARTRHEIVQLLLDQISQVLLTQRVEQQLTGIESFLQQQLELEPGSLGIRLGVPSAGDLVQKVELYAQARPDVPAMPVHRWGRGYSALCAVALFRALNELGDQAGGSLVLIEEPEVFLGPHLREVFAQALQAFSSIGNQVLVVTHSPEFYDAFDPQSAILVRQDGGATRCTQWPRSQPAPTFDMALKFIEPKLSQILFSRRLLFVEGPDDYAAVRTALDLAGVDPAYLGLQVIQLGGKDNARHLGPYSKCFEVPHAYLLDADARVVLCGIDATGDSWALFDPDLEGCLGVTKRASHNTAAVVSALAASSSWSGLKTDRPGFAGPLAKALSHVGVALP